MDEIYVSAAQYEKMAEELREAERKLARAREAVGEAASFGDLSENAEYDAARAETDLFEARSAFLRERIARSRIVEKMPEVDGEARIGSTVKAKDLGTRSVETFILVGGGDADFSKGEVPYNSPFGLPFCGRKVGDVVEVVVPAGKFRYEILAVS